MRHPMYEFAAAVLVNRDDFELDDQIVPYPFFNYQYLKILVSKKAHNALPVIIIDLRAEKGARANVEISPKAFVLVQ